MKQKSLILLAAAIALALSASICSAAAYFTTYAEARGGHTIRLEGERHIEEEFFDWTKHVRIESTGTSDCYVRAKAFAPTGYELLYTSEDGSWILADDGWFYYGPILEGGASTSELLVKIENIPEDPEQNDNFDVVVVYECTPVQYENGNPYADWSLASAEGRDQG